MLYSHLGPVGALDLNTANTAQPELTTSNLMATALLLLATPQ